MVKFGYTILYVPDVERSLAFYEKAFGFERKFIAPGNEYGELASGETTLSFAATTLGNSNLKDGFLESKLSDKPFGFEIALVTDDIDKTILQAEKAGATVVEKPKQKPWGQTVAYVRDPDGFLIEICTAMG
ncbi:MAG TPA: VOC family protein [Chitinophagaceae bacterium]|nr:VOC family protein [Chitinophagaceae bacterium]